MENKKLISPKQIFNFIIRFKLILALCLVLIVGVCLALYITKDEQPEPKIVVESSLKGFKDIAELSVLEYPYSSYVTVYKKDVTADE